MLFSYSNRSVRTSESGAKQEVGDKNQTGAGSKPPLHTYRRPAFMISKKPAGFNYWQLFLKKPERRSLATRTSYSPKGYHYYLLTRFEKNSIKKILLPQEKKRKI